MRRIYLFLLTLSFFVASQTFGLECDLEKSFAVSASAIKLQNERIKIASENLANEGTTGELPGSDPYKRKKLFVENRYDKKLKAKLVKTKKVRSDRNPKFKVVYDHSHIAADENGYVKYPDVDKEIELGDVDEARRSQNASLAMIGVTKKMITDTLEIMK